jgi:hypothetical protein
MISGAGLLTQRTGLTMGSSAGLDLIALRVASRPHHMFRPTPSRIQKSIVP